MKKFNLTKVMASLLIMALVMVLNPIGASAEWKQDTTGWWYTEGSSYATAWREINGSKYYFYSNGYMAHDKVIDGYYLNSSGKFGAYTVFPKVSQNNYVIYREGYRNNRLEICFFDIKYSPDNSNNYVKWNSSITLGDNSRYTNEVWYYLSDDNNWVKFGTEYDKISDLGTDIMASSLDVKNSNNVTILKGTGSLNNSSTINKLPSLPNDNNKQYIVYAEGYRSNRMELVMFDVKNNKDINVNWSQSLELKDNDLYENDTKYYLSDDGTQWIKFETNYNKISDYATNVYYSSLDVYKNGSKIIISKEL